MCVLYKKRDDRLQAVEKKGNDRLFYDPFTFTLLHTTPSSTLVLIPRENPSTTPAARFLFIFFYATNQTPFFFPIFLRCHRRRRLFPHFFSLVFMYTCSDYIYMYILHNIYMCTVSLCRRFTVCRRRPKGTRDDGEGEFISGGISSPRPDQSS